ncbi:hypothetical protein FHR32_005966 [Streptosporangium album]|uniref:Uncharacterized protein n=1 Tax=Streptosporangium album TaxID=47479 RepID=A0A7W7S0D3_9ACTN|nr:hypothetical protein [Streptosporangium album]MBB4941589.1 hypothetical protein [Streptosporangium album]
MSATPRSAGPATITVPTLSASALTAVTIGKPGENAWFDRLPRLTYVEVVTGI